MLENTNNSGQRRFVAERYPHAGADADPLREFFWHGVIELAVDRPINNDPNVIGSHHALVAIRARARARNRNRLL